MLQITERQAHALAVHQAEGFRQRAYDHVRKRRAELGEPQRAQLDAAFTYAEAAAARHAFQAERSRLALFLLALAGGPGILETPDVAAAIGDRETPERIRIRALARQLGGGR